MPPVPPTLDHLPRLIGHRGARAAAPENTLAGLREAVHQGATWVEVDVKLTRDGVPILMHDDTLERTTNGSGLVRDCDLAALRPLDAGSRFAARFAGEPVPTLAEFLALAAELVQGVNLEIKPCPGREQETAAVALAVARQVWPAHRPPPLISSFELASLETARDLAPDWPRGYLMEETPADWRDRADHIGAASLHVDQQRQTADSIAALRASGRPVLAYTVNDAARAATLWAWGVTSVFTDRPGDLMGAGPEGVNDAKGRAA